MLKISEWLDMLYHLLLSIVTKQKLENINTRDPSKLIEG